MRADYLSYLRDSYRYLDMKGVRQVQQVTQQLHLTAVYVPLKAQAGHASSAGRVAGRPWSGMEGSARDTLAAVELVRYAEPVPVEKALHTDPAVVVLGDPGAGKSTLLKVLALALANQPHGPLPILLPLNAYARGVQQGERSVSQFLSDYYASRQHKLQRVGELFQQALAQQQALILLDGLDEVQANRAHVVRLVQDFVAEQVPQPRDFLATGTDDAQPPVPGNRVVVTSRIVGYDDAPLSGPQWRTYTLTDFNRADIEQFVTQWTLALARSIQGDTEPARQAATQERRELLDAIRTRPSVERLAANPLLLTILSLIKHTGVRLPEQRVKLYKLYLETLIESWNLARSLDQHQVGEPLNYEETVQVLAPLALWLRQENPTAGLVTQEQLETWLTNYYSGDEWQLPRGQARQRGRAFLDSVQRYSNVLLERGEGQYGFLHLTLEEMLAAQGLAQCLDEQRDQALALFRHYLLDPVWHETLQLAIGVIGVNQVRAREAGAVLQAILASEAEQPQRERGRAVLFAGEALLDMGARYVNRPVARAIEQAMLQTMQDAACPIRTRRDAGNVLGRLGWTPEGQADDLILAPAGHEPTGLDAFRPVPGRDLWMGKYLVTNRQFARFIQDGGYLCRDYWSEDGWSWRQETYDDTKAHKVLQDWLKQRPVDRRYRPFWWEDRKWNSPLFPVVGVSWFEAEAYARWLTVQFCKLRDPATAPEVLQRIKAQQLAVRLPTEAEWEAAIGGTDDYPWGARFDFTRLNCAESWTGKKFANNAEWFNWRSSEDESRRDASTTAVTTYLQGVSSSGIWDGSGNAWEWMGNLYRPGGNTRALRGGAWLDVARNARASSRVDDHPVAFGDDVGLRVAVAPVLVQSAF